MQAATHSCSSGSKALYATSASPSLRTTPACWRLTSSRIALRSASLPSSATMRYWPVVRWRLNGCLSTRPLSTVLSATPRPTGSSDSCMTTLAAPNSAEPAITPRDSRSISAGSTAARGALSSPTAIRAVPPQAGRDAAREHCLDQRADAGRLGVEVDRVVELRPAAGRREAHDALVVLEDAAARDAVADELVGHDLDVGLHEPGQRADLELTRRAGAVARPVGAIAEARDLRAEQRLEVLLLAQVGEQLVDGLREVLGHVHALHARHPFTHAQPA